ncbi:MAG: hypothetical protein EXS14_00540 [Planctomycetes bacterium]|nr:hypothetical protein [Planctomycetota bacterium]
MRFILRAELRLALLFSAFLLVGCASAPTSPTPAPSPLGPGYPNPDVILADMFRCMEAKDWPGLCATIAVPDAQGKPAALVPGKSAPETPPSDAWLPQAEVVGLRGFLQAPWKRLQYSAPRSLANDPPLLALTVRVTYDYDAVPESERRMLLGAESARAGRVLDWNTVVTGMRQRERMEASGLIAPQRLGFALIDGRWRLWLGPLNR